MSKFHLHLKLMLFSYADPCSCVLSGVFVGREFMESIVSLSVGACVSFVIFYQYCDYFDLSHITQDGVVVRF